MHVELCKHINSTHIYVDFAVFFFFLLECYFQLMINVLITCVYGSLKKKEKKRLLLCIHYHKWCYNIHTCPFLHTYMIVSLDRISTKATNESKGMKILYFVIYYLIFHQIIYSNTPTYCV